LNELRYHDNEVDLGYDSFNIILRSMRVMELPLVMIGEIVSRSCIALLHCWKLLCHHKFL